LEYVPGNKNEAADALSRLPTAAEPFLHDFEAFATEHFRLEENSFPLDLRVISDAQAKDNELKFNLGKKENRRNKKNVSYKRVKFGNLYLWCVDGGDNIEKVRIYIPNSLKREIVSWYHINLMHPALL